MWKHLCKHLLIVGDIRGTEGYWVNMGITEGTVRNMGIFVQYWAGGWGRNEGVQGDDTRVFG